MRISSKSSDDLRASPPAGPSSPRLSLLFLGLAAPGMLLCFLLGGPLGEVAFALLATLFPVALMALGAGREGGRRLAGVFSGLACLLLAGVGGMLLFRGRVAELPWFGGLPLAGALQIYLIFGAPLLLVALAYGLTFDRHALRPEDLEALRGLRQEPDEKSIP